MKRQQKIATYALMCIFLGQAGSIQAKDDKPTAPPKKVYVVDFVTPAPNSHIQMDALALCHASDHLMKALAIYAPKNNVEIEKVSVAAGKELTANVLRLEVDQIVNEVSRERRRSRLSVNARFIVSDGSPRAHNFDCSIEGELRAPFENNFSCPRFVKCSKTIARDMAYWLTAFK